MREIKIQCDCGQKYKFDAEPVRGVMPYSVKCPICGLDGTEKANAVLAGLPEQEFRAAPAPSTAFPGASSSASGGTAVLNSPIPAIRPASTAQPATPASAGPANLPLGLLGAVAAGLVGMLAWYFLIKLTGYEIGYAAWGVGVLTGFGARVLGRRGSQPLGVVAAVCAFLAILGGEYLAVKIEADKVFTELMTKAYQNRVEYAKEAEGAQSDDQIKALLVKYEETESPTAEDIKEFRDTTQPKLKEFAVSKSARNDFEKRSAEFRNSLGYNFSLLKESVGLLTIVFLLLGVSSAYKIATG